LLTESNPVAVKDKKKKKDKNGHLLIFPPYEEEIPGKKGQSKTLFADT
jgi:hypothetical protein